MRLTYSHDCTDDTTLDYDGKGLLLSFTSGEPDCGTEELLYNSDEATPMEMLAKDLLAEISGYLDGNGPDLVYDDYSEAALYAFETILRNI